MTVATILEQLKTANDSEKTKLKEELKTELSERATTRIELANPQTLDFTHLAEALGSNNKKITYLKIDTLSQDSIPALVKIIEKAEELNTLHIGTINGTSHINTVDLLHEASITPLTNSIAKHLKLKHFNWDQIKDQDWKEAKQAHYDKQWAKFALGLDLLLGVVLASCLFIIAAPVAAAAVLAVAVVGALALGVFIYKKNKQESSAPSSSELVVAEPSKTVASAQSEIGAQIINTPKVENPVQDGPENSPRRNSKTI